MSEQSSSGGGTVVQSTNPSAALQAGVMGEQAAQMANTEYSADVNTALADVNQNFTAALQGLQPAEQSGVQALDQMNQLMSLSPYQGTNPGPAPTLASEEAQVTPSQINAYLDENSSLTDYMSNTSNPALGGSTAPTLQWDYTGAGANDPAAQSGVASQFAAEGVANPSGTNNLYSPDQTYVADANTPQTAFLGNNNLTLGNSNSGVSNALTQDITASLGQTALTAALPAYNTAEANYTQDQNWAQQYGTPLTTAQITQQITNEPGYQAQLGQGIQAINQADTASGYLGSGAILQDLMNYGQNTLSTYYGNTLSRLATEASAGQSAATTAAGVESNLSQDQSQLLGDLGTSAANSTISGSQSLMQGLIAANPEFSVLGGSSSSSTNLSGAGSAIGAISSAFSGGGF